MTINGGISFWYATDRTAPPTPPRAPLDGDPPGGLGIGGGGYTRRG
ncbi:hypothetical protein, partial [Streptomyces xanthophaeus]